MSLPFSDEKKIDLSDKPIFDEYFLLYPPEISEFTFSNLFMWRNYYDYRFLEWRDHLLIFSRTYLKKWKAPRTSNEVIFFLQPIGPFPELIMIEILKIGYSIEFHRISESILNSLIKKAENENISLEVIDDRNNWDYVYEKNDLVSLPGNKLRQKRRNLQKFLSSYDHRFNLLKEEIIEDCKQLQLEWCDANECQGNEDLQEEEKAIFNVFDNFKTLNVKGGALFIQNDCVAYTLGEKLNENTMVIHVEKAHANYEGSYQAINNYFIKNCCQSVNLINREQDLGIEGIRYAKESYKPHHMVKKYIILRRA
ncbi:MAG: DUF2156 domain-containing protein [Candidatus Lokiarchaeota archaeon]|nr:DUF2156 domain-containing protein [Candidatus Lokiarchaeota archaeon]